MRTTVKCLLPTLAAALTLAACGSSGSGSSSSQASSSTPATTVAATQSAASTTAIVKTASNSKLGASILTSSSGMTLYTLSGERNGKFICSSSACLHVWHPVTVAATVTPSGVSSLATVKRSDGTVQVTYKGAPLYTFAEDKAPGEDNGQGIKDVGTWSVVKIGTAAPASQAASESSSAEPSGSAPAQSEPESSKGGYAY